MEQAEAARHIGETLVARLDYVGILGVELFDTAEGLIINEIAPRVHNSGHVTADACAVGQFEQHIRAITGWPLGATDMHSQGEMTNILGQRLTIGRNLPVPRHMRAFIRQTGSARGRKMGHFTRLAPLSRKLKKSLFKLNVFIAAAPVAQQVGKRRFAVTCSLPFRLGLFKLHDIFNATVKKRPAFLIAVALIAKPHKPRRAQYTA